MGAIKVTLLRLSYLDGSQMEQGISRQLM